MRMITTTVLSLSLIAGTMAPAAASAGLADEKDINAGLLAVSVAEKIQRECSSIGGRFFRARKYVNGLKGMALDRGYSQSQIEAYVNDKPNQRAMRVKRNAYFKSQGASNLDAQSLCVLGRAEIHKKSRVGSLLKAK